MDVTAIGNLEIEKLPKINKTNQTSCVVAYIQNDKSNEI